ncbi:MAG: 4Fe-4S binding protein [Deltaproteobacteria bacterium]|nr:4Fe-4S binding protein [Deltaproteobacteria bacterium]
MQDVYQGLREHLDRLPGGYPATESGVEIRILERLFTPEEAALAQALRLKLEPAEVIAERAGLPAEETLPKLLEMARKGLIFSIETGERPPAFMASQFVVGIWEYHLNDLDPEFIALTDEYFPYLTQTAFDTMPQLRTIPVGRSLATDTPILAYEEAEKLIQGQKKILVAPCICRKEHQIKGGGCDKPLETCLVFGWGADYYERNQLGRMITADEARNILKSADEAGLVLQPSNSQDITNICCCCGDCCQALLSLKRHPSPAERASTPFVVAADVEACIGCETCLERCQMEALVVEDDQVRVLAERCIGCGLCVSTCPTEALSLVRKPDSQQPRVPANPMEAMKARVQARAELTAKLERHQRL